MMPYRLSLDAQRDLAAVWTQGAERWGSTQADHYLNQIDAAMKALASGTAVITTYPETKPPLVFTRVGRHLLFATADDSPLFVAVLHERSDYASRLAWRIS